MSDVESCKAELKAIEQEQVEFNEHLKKLVNAYKAQLREDHRETSDDIYARLAAARTKLFAAEDEAAKHPWEGKRVRREKSIYEKRWSREKTTVVEYGIVDVMRHDTKVSDTYDFERPRIGAAFVRRIKKNGEGALTIYTDIDSRNDWIMKDWQLCDE